MGRIRPPDIGDGQLLGALQLICDGGPERVPIPGYPWVPGIYVVATLWFATYMAIREPGQAGMGALTVLSGLPFYWWCRR